MLVLAVTAVLGIVVGIVSYAAVRYGRLDFSAPRVARATVADEVERHRSLAAWLERRTDPAVATGSVLTAVVLLIVAGLIGVGILLAMVRTHRGFASFDVSASRFGADHATAASTRILRLLTQL